MRPSRLIRGKLTPSSSPPPSLPFILTCGKVCSGQVQREDGPFFSLAPSALALLKLQCATLFSCQIETIHHAFSLFKGLADGRARSLAESTVSGWLVANCEERRHERERERENLLGGDGRRRKSALTHWGKGPSVASKQTEGLRRRANLTFYSMTLTP